MDAVSILLAFASGFIVAWTLKPGRTPQRSIHQPQPPKEQFDVAANRARKQAKEERLQQLLDCIDMNGRITSREVEEMFGVSSATATRYLTELTASRKIKKHGKGRGVHYTL